MKEKITNLHEVRRDNNANQGGGSKLIIRTFGGTEDVNKTMTVYEYGGEMIIVDCGIVINPTPNNIITPPMSINNVGVSPRNTTPPINENIGSNNKNGATFPTL